MEKVGKNIVYPLTCSLYINFIYYSTPIKPLRYLKDRFDVLYKEKKNTRHKQK